MSTTQEILEKLNTYTGFVYRIGREYYFIGRWLFKPCDELDAQDCCEIFLMSDHERESQEAALYYKKVRAHSDFALEAPCDPVGTRAAIAEFLEGLSEKDLAALEKQIEAYEKCHLLYEGELPKAKKPVR